MAIIKAQSVDKRIETLENPIPILKGLELSVNSGETVAIMGASGSGKSTLISLLAGLDLPSKGSIVLMGKALEKMTQEARARHRLGAVGLIFQSFHLLMHFTALENVMLPLLLMKAPEAEKKAKQLLQRVGLSARLSHYPQQLSGGEQQRVAIARAFVTQPKILFCDEPTGNLDLKTGEWIVSMLFELNQNQQTTLLFVTHDKWIATRCQKQYVLRDGKLHE